jgi:hypothetical protein
MTPRQAKASRTAGLRAPKDGWLDRYRAGARRPGQRTIDPYAGRFAEVTLDRTQVARVVPRYERGRGKVRPNITSE